MSRVVDKRFFEIPRPLYSAHPNLKLTEILIKYSHKVQYLCTEMMPTQNINIFNFNEIKCVGIFCHIIKIFF